MNIKVMTLNMWYGRYIDEVIEFIREERPDVVMLQEVTASRKIDIPHGISDSFELLMDRLKMQGVFAPGWRLILEGKLVGLGLATFTKLPIEYFGAKYYIRGVLESGDPSFGVNFPGFYLRTDVNTEVGVLPFITTHFFWSMYPEITDEQRLGAKLLKNELSPISDFVLAGDFNVTDDSEIYREISKGLVDDRPEGLVRTLHPEIHKVGPSLDLAVDYMFHRGNRFRVKSSRVPIVPVSDHLPLVVEYEVE